MAVNYHIPICAAILAPLQLSAQPVRDLRMEYRKSENGYHAVLTNRRDAAATAYIAQATFRLEGKQKPTAFGGDTMAYPGGGDRLPPGSVSDTNNGLPAGALPLTSGIMAAIYADGYTEGDQSVVQMLLSGRHRSYLDLPAAIRWMEQAASGKLDGATVTKRFQEMRGRNMAEAKQLDEMVVAPGVNHGIFMTAVPSHALMMLRTASTPETVQIVARTLAEAYKEWLEELRASKPEIK